MPQFPGNVEMSAVVLSGLFNIRLSFFMFKVDGQAPTGVQCLPTDEASNPASLKHYFTHPKPNTETKAQNTQKQTKQEQTSQTGIKGCILERETQREAGKRAGTTFAGRGRKYLAATPKEDAEG